MASLSLPPPRKTAPLSLQKHSSSTSNSGSEVEGTRTKPQATTAASTVSSDNNNQTAQRRHIPSYGERCGAAARVARLSPEQRRNEPPLFVPRSLQDFGDGGAFPEIHVAQYPRHMGNPHRQRQQQPVTKGAAAGGGTVGASSASRAIVQVEVDKDGDVSYDALVKGGTNVDKLVYSRHEDLRPDQSKLKAEDIALPTEEEEAAEAARTQAALGALLQKKTALDKPSGSAIQNAETSKDMEAKTQFIKYTPRPDAPGYNPAAAQRVIQMVPKQVDPMMPPKHKHIKAPRGPAEDPVPVLHAPPKKLTKEEREAWNIPACISNWKNVRGYTIPLDKRLAADGRGLREHTINPNFATVSESLYVAERQARQEVRLRAQVQKKLAIAEKERREEELRELAQQARMERSGAAPAAEPVEPERQAPAVSGGGASVVREEEDASSHEGDDERRERPDTEDEVAARQREKMRLERKREREREMRLDKNMEAKRKKLEEERDVSEKIALGVHTGHGGGLSGDVDSRLYSQSGGMDSGFGADDDYDVYSKPMFDRQHGVSGSSIYRPTRGETEHNADESYQKLKEGATSKFQPDKGFSGAEGGMDVRAGPRTAPVQFQKGDGSGAGQR